MQPTARLTSFLSQAMISWHCFIWILYFDFRSITVICFWCSNSILLFVQPVNLKISPEPVFSAGFLHFAGNRSWWLFWVQNAGMKLDSSPCRYLRHGKSLGNDAPREYVPPTVLLGLLQTTEIHIETVTDKKELHGLMWFLKFRVIKSFYFFFFSPNTSLLPFSFPSILCLFY